MYKQQGILALKLSGMSDKVKDVDKGNGMYSHKKKPIPQRCSLECREPKGNFALAWKNDSKGPSQENKRMCGLLDNDQNAVFVFTLYSTCLIYVTGMGKEYVCAG